MKARYFHRRNPLDGYDDSRLDMSFPRDALEAFDNALGAAIEDAMSRGQIKRYERQDGKGSANLPLARAFSMCIIEDDNKNELARGYAFCSELDYFSKKVGRAKSFGRAFAELTEEQRAQLLRDEQARQEARRQAEQEKREKEVRQRMDELVEIRLAEVQAELEKVRYIRGETQEEQEVPDSTTPEADDGEFPRVLDPAIYAPLGGSDSPSTGNVEDETTTEEQPEEVSEDPVEEPEPRRFR